MKEGIEMTENAKRIWNIAKAAGLDALLEQYVDDLDAFAADLDSESEQEVLKAIYRMIGA